MMKKILLMLTVMFAALSANAQKWEKIAEVDFSADGATVPSASWTDATATIEDGALVIVHNASTSNTWEFQYPLISNLQLTNGANYQVKISMSADKAGTSSNWLGIFDATDPKYGQNFAAGDQTLTYKCVGKVDTNEGMFMMQTGTFVGTLKFYSIEVYEFREVYNPDVPVQGWLDVTAAEHVQKIYNNQFSNVSGEISVVTPAKKETDWDSQFWFVMNEPMAEDGQVKLTFDAKASSAQSLGFGAHGKPDGNNWKAGGICDAVALTTEWQTYTRTFDVKAGWQSFAVDLSKATEVTYDFKNIKIQKKADLVAPVPAYSEVATDGETVQYIYNVETGTFVLGANDWGTRASVSTTGYQFKVKDNGNNTYTLNDLVEKFGDWRAMFADNGNSIWVDNVNGANVKGWVITENGDGTGTYSITNPAAAGEAKLGVKADIKADSRLYMNEDAVNNTWAFLSADEYAAFAGKLAAYKEAVAEAMKQNTYVGTPITDAAPSAWTNQGNGYGPGVERYNTSMYEGDVMTQTISGLVPGTKYAVTLQAAASYTPGRGFDGNTGLGYTAVFANEGMLDIEVVERTAVSGGDSAYGPYTVVGTVDEDGNLTYGMKNVFEGGNWFVIALNSIVVTNEAVSFAPVIWEKQNPKTIEPALVNGEEEIALNSHSEVSVDFAQAIRVNFVNFDFVNLLGGAYAINAMKEVVGEESSTWVVDESYDIAVGELSVNTIGYAELDSAIYFEQGMKYQVKVTAFYGDPENPQEMVEYFVFNGSYVPELAVLPSLIAGEEEIALNAHSNVSVEVANALKVEFENGASIIGASYSINEMVMNEDEEGIFWTVGAELAVGEMSLNTIAYAELDSTLIFEQGKKYQLTVTAYENAAEPTEVGTYTYEFNGAYAPALVVIPSLVLGEEEVALNDHSNVSVESASALKVEFENGANVIGATYLINVMDQKEDEEGMFWTVGAELASGEMSLNTIAYAELDSLLFFEQGKKYQLTVVPFENAAEPTEIGQYYFEFNGSYVAPIELAVALIAEDGETEYALNTHSFVTIDVPVVAITVAGLDQTMETISYAIYDKRETLAEGVLSVNTIGYAEFPENISFYEGIMYNIVLKMGEDSIIYDNYVIGAIEAPAELEDCDLTQEMFKQYYSNTTGDKLDEPAAIGCDYNVGTSTGMVYGLSTVKWYAYANLDGYSKLVLNVTEGAPRLMLNRDIDPNKTPEDDGVNHIEINSAANEFVTVVGNEWIIDLEAIYAKYGRAHLNAMKGANWANTTVNSMKLFVTAEAAEEYVNTVGINSIDMATKNGKFMQNGKIVIVKNGKTYNVAGQLIK